MYYEGGGGDPGRPLTVNEFTYIKRLKNGLVVDNFGGVNSGGFYRANQVKEFAKYSSVEVMVLFPDDEYISPMSTGMADFVINGFHAYLPATHPS